MTMPRRRVRGSRFAGARGSGPRRKTEWIAATVSLHDLAGVSSELSTSFSQAQLASLVPFTVTRTILTVVHAIDAGFVTDQDYFCGVGVCTVRENARASGIAVLPLPLADLGDDVWFAHQVFGAFLEEVLTSNAAVLTSQSFTLDSRGQRKVEDGDGIAVIVQNTAGDAVQLALAIRILCKLH